MRKSLTVIIFQLLLSQLALADFINLVQADKCETILEIFIEKDRIIARLEIGEQDYPWFSDVIAEKYYEKGFTNVDQTARRAQFFRNQFVLKQGNKLIKGTVLAVEQRQRQQRSKLYTGQEDTSFLDSKIIFVEIEYSLASQIASLSIQPPMPTGQETSPANIGFVVYHKSIPVNDLRFLVKKETVHLNWEDPWYSYFDNPEISRHHSSSFMSFLYIEPYEVRHEILVRIKDLEDWIPFDYGMDDIIEINEQDSIKQLIANFLVKRNIVQIDGEARKPIIDKVHFIEVQLSGIQIMEIPRPLPYASAIIGVIFAYQDKGLPSEVSISWDMFNDKISIIPAMSIGPEGPWPHDLQPSDSVLTWKNFLKHYQLPTVTEQKVEDATMHVPVLTIIFVLMSLFILYRVDWKLNHLSKIRKFLFVLYILLALFSYPIGTKAIIPFMDKQTYSAPEAKELISQLLKNTYRAFDFREEGDIYDKLSICNDEALLQKIYLDTRKSMKIENQGGIEARVNEVMVKSVNEIPNESEGLAYECNWIVKGEVGHWGHKHQRINEYDAIIRIRPVDGAWKMYDLEMIEEKRL